MAKSSKFAWEPGDVKIVKKGDKPAEDEPQEGDAEETEEPDENAEND